MPWEIAIVRSPTDEKVPLGERDAVIGAVTSALPNVVLENPGLPPEEFLATLSPMTREAFARPQLTGLYQDDCIVFEFYTLDLPQIPFLCGNVRGSGNPIPVLRRLCLANGWSVVSSYNKAVVDLAAESSPEWETFCGYRAQCLNTKTT
jgi:hypothetical protein